MEAIFRVAVLGALASALVFVATLLVDNWYLRGTIFIVIVIVGWRMSRELLIQIIARLSFIALGWGVAWLASKGVTIVAPRADNVVFYGIGLLWTVIGGWGLIREVRRQFFQNRISN
jgi:hypothetical protein